MGVSSMASSSISYGQDPSFGICGHFAFEFASHLNALAQAGAALA